MRKRNSAGNGKSLHGNPAGVRQISSESEVERVFRGRYNQDTSYDDEFTRAA